uniref:Peptidyl-prolyl cis-trans isomerase n=2 Tax=Lotharella globosa TaxID=91324 RepID=A0A6U2X9Z1_9EUKA|mmetsp:Transcript_14624/g.29591  ORF Transcript_14624/g.29591 Transcript_14624/m.29591 type:complete len:169 (-) Transcript_14624:123-629(-)|eukprot:CAMPEP_0167781432 /NCGR_PEP_ID=MMETSP0111_2-20121227/5928_1 /TAXON_ID=91324 /ORGANISM="Lotharella globosa, Strain CCCM811" /LENGTH=168 /DNA_ID=CAMNT_0007672091 /DNA_START=46 /DNA_END=552 /DNA_ORIENTATION=+
MAVTLHTTLGDLKLELFCDLCPVTCKNFLALCASGYYNGTIFHRNIAKFMIQGGDPSGTGKGGKSIYGKYFEDEISSVLKHNARGTVSMANRGPNTNGSQFFITYGKQKHLNNVNTVFAKVIHGMNTLDAMERVPVGKKDRPVHEIKINKITIHANPIAEKEEREGES